MGRLRGLPTVLVMLLGGAAVALVAGAALYALKRRPGPEAEWAEGVAALAEQEAATEAAREMDRPEGLVMGVDDSGPIVEASPTPVIDRPEPPEPGPLVREPLGPPEAETVALPGRSDALASRTVASPTLTAGEPASEPAPEAETTEAHETSPLVRGVLILGAALVGVLIGLVIYLATGGTIVR